MRYQDKSQTLKQTYYGYQGGRIFAVISNDNEAISCNLDPKKILKATEDKTTYEDALWFNEKQITGYM